MDSWINFTTLSHENTVYQDLAGDLGIPSVVWFGACGNYALLVMNLLGQSLESLHQERKHANYSDKPFLSMDKIARLAVQMIDRVRYIHSKGYIHGDIKPENMVLGGTDGSTLFFIDFGVAQKYVDNEKNHIKFQHGKPMKGTPMFASAHAHRGSELSRRDDMISLGYALAYLINGKLPWTVDATMDQVELDRSFEMQKSRLAVNVFEDLPDEYFSYIKNVYNLKFRQRPRYGRLIRPFQSILDASSEDIAMQDTSASSSSPYSFSSASSSSSSSSSLLITSSTILEPPRSKKRRASPSSSGSSHKRQRQ